MEEINIDESYIKELLTKITDLKEKNDLKPEVIEERYNFFRFLGLPHDECVFSRMIAHLLKVKESHGCKDIFLKYFINHLDSSIPENLNYLLAQVEIEKDIGPRNDKEKTGGRIDIFISIPDLEGNNWAFVIENKVYAEDQNVQLRRYKNFLNKYYKDRHYLLYLTLDGKIPSKESADMEIEDYDEQSYWIQISYRDFIIDWLKYCLSETKNKPRVYETIKQFLGQIERLTGQNMNNEEIMNLLSKPENVTAAKILASSYRTMRVTKINETKNRIQKIVDTNFDIKDRKPKEYKKPGDSNYSLIYCRKDAWKRLRIDVIFGASDFDLKINITFRKSITDKDMKKQISSLIGQSYISNQEEWNWESEYSVCRKVFPEFKDWIDAEEEICSSMKKAIDICDSFESNVKNF